MRDLATELRCILDEAKLNRDGDRYRGTFYGNNDGTWTYKETMIHGLSHWDWGGTLGLSSENGWKNIYVDNTVEDNPAFLKALREMVKKYPELKDFKIAFDGPLMRVSDLLRKRVEKDINWSKVVFYHGTSSKAWEKIKRLGLVPRRASGARAAYGVSVGAVPGREDAIYLTTQENTALFAARDATRGTGSDPVVLKIVGIDGKYVAPDEDSREATAIGSFRKTGSIAYVGKISPRKISLFKVFDGKRWFKEDCDESVSVREYPKAGSKVSGLTVEKNVPNMSSISASLTDYTVLRGIRRVPMKDFEVTQPKKLFYAKDDLDRVRNLADRIKQTGRIEPLIVVVDDKGIYVLEGGHRLGALHILGVKELPALIVHDDEALGTAVDEGGEKNEIRIDKNVTQVYGT